MDSVSQFCKRALLSAAVALPLLAAARFYTPQGSCAGFERLPITSPAGTCVALVADEREGLRAPRRILEVAPGRYWLLDMGSWEPRQGRLLEMRLPAAGETPYRARFTVLAQALDRPLGVVRGPDGKIYIGEAGSVWRTPLPAPGGRIQRETVIDGLPDDGTHPLKELAFGPDGRLYVNVGSASDDCREGANAPLPCPQREGERPRAAVYEAVLTPGTGALQSFKPFALGLRNSVTLTVLQSGPAKGTVLQGENSIDYRQVDQPAEELNRLQRGRDYGWPYCVANRQRAQAYAQYPDCGKTEAPLMLWPAHAAPLQMLVGSTGTRFANQLLVAWRGPQTTGHRVVGFRLDARGLPSGAPIDWLSGWHAEPGRRPLGRPTGITVDSAGRLLVVEDYNRTVLMLLPEASAPPVPSAPSSATPR